MYSLYFVKNTRTRTCTCTCAMDTHNVRVHVLVYNIFVASFPCTCTHFLRYHTWQNSLDLCFPPSTRRVWTRTFVMCFTRLVVTLKQKVALASLFTNDTIMYMYVYIIIIISSCARCRILSLGFLRLHRVSV